MLLSLRPLMLFTVHAIFVAAQNEWIYPKPMGKPEVYDGNEIFVVDSRINLAWRTNYTALSIVMWQNGNSEFRYLPDGKNVTTIQFLPWTVSLMDFNLDDGIVFFFGIFDEDPNHAGRPPLQSNYFNITDNSAVSSISTISSSAVVSSTISSSSATTTATTAGPSISGAATSTSSAAITTVVASSGGVSNTAKVGIGVGVGVGVFALLIGVAVGMLLAPA